MKRRLLLRLGAIIALGTALLFWSIDWLSDHAEQRMSFLADEHRAELVAMGREAERIYYQQGEQALAAWIDALGERENTWVAVVEAKLFAKANTRMSERYMKYFSLGRSVDWKIHLYFAENPTMEVAFEDGVNRFLIRLPQRMRPGTYYLHLQWLLKVVLPLVLLSVLTLVVYRYVMRPLKRLERATREFSEGDYQVRVRDSLGNREDELTALASTFDQMAERTGNLIITQRQLLADLSHELRAPLARMDMAIDSAEQGLDRTRAHARLRQESVTMRRLVEDTLTLAWLDNESPQLCADDFDLVELIQVICDDARFEFPNHRIDVQLPDSALLLGSSQRALGQALENILRNALNYTPEGLEVRVSLQSNSQQWKLMIVDQGPGVPQALLGKIFKPFYRVDSARQPAAEQKRQGFGLGLALALRQVQAVRGNLVAYNHYLPNQQQPAGLTMVLTLARD